MFKGKLLACDMDGTLLNSRNRVSRENIDAIRYFVDNGGMFTIATGRMEASLREYLPELSLNVPAILYNGALIYDFLNEKTVITDCLQESVENVVKKVIEVFPEVGIEIFHGGDVYFPRESDETERHKIKESLNPICVPVEKVPKPWYKVIIAWKPEHLSKIENFLRPYLDSFDMVYSEPQFLELLNKNVSKGSALEKLTSYIGCSLEEVIAVGDHMNDLEMVRICGAGFAVGNAHEKLKENARFLCCHHDEHPIVEVVEWIKMMAEGNK